MPKVYHKKLGRAVALNRLIGKIKGSLAGPTVVFIAGIHGNEPSGVFALKKVMASLRQQKAHLKGSIYALAGNLWALEHGQRYHRQDLNRLWSAERVAQLGDNSLSIADQDVAQQVALYQLLREILEKEQGPFYFMDLHTTSCETIPFVVLNDSLLNRKFTAQYPLPMILGIEEYLEGPLLSYINELGYVAFGFEAGQHDDLSSIEHQEAFIMLSLVFTGCLARAAVDFNHYYGILARSSVESRHFYEIFFRYKIRAGEQFQMEPGYVNFQHVKKGQKLATSNGRTIYADRNAKLFMPLYQSQGADGFFAIRKVPRYLLHMSAAIRRLQIDQLLSLLPGVSWVSPGRQALRVDRKVARFFTKQIFHLMGYRSMAKSRRFYVMKNREAASREGEYKNEAWV